MKNKFSKRKINSRGFNMFSALVAIILVMTGVVMTSMLISTEENTSRQIYSMRTNYQLADEASIARADALQSFNYNFREKFESYLTDNMGFTLFVMRGADDLMPGKFSFENMEKNFQSVVLQIDKNEGQRFDAVINFVAERTVDQFKPGTYGRFSVYLNDNGTKAKQAVYNAIKGAIQNEDFLEVLDCGDNECKNGSFYLNIPLNKLGDESYEALPRIVVKDLITQEEIKTPILPRTNLKVYIPLRFFKALYEARKTAYIVQAAHNELAAYKLGFCDNTICAPREHQKKSQATQTWTQKCPANEAGSTVFLKNNAGNIESILGVGSYNSGGNLPGAYALKAYGANEICNRATAPASMTFISDDENFTVRDTFLSAKDYGGTPVDGCGFSSLVVVVNAGDTKLVTGEDEGARLRCSQVTAVRAEVVLEEKNPLYIVRGTFEKAKRDLYKIRIEDETFEQIPPPKAAADLQKCLSINNTCKPD